MTTQTIAISPLDLMKQLAPGYYTERDGGLWYIVTPDHGHRIGEDFVSRDDARRLMIWVAGGPKPEGWTVSGDLDGTSCTLKMPDQYSEATLWLRTIRDRFQDSGVLKELASNVEGARAGVIEALGGAIAKPTDRDRLEALGYRLVTRAEFEAAKDRPPGLLERAAAYAGAFVAYDPEDRAKGFLLVGDDPDALAFEMARHLELVQHE